ncbi:Formin-like protein 4 [Sesamum alatum]|uniref:Formin-like protein n=1 Tax=Sesamum alatum TaxID=300844 RepID=A0AAE1YW60_9LAMI|nr:Formin-like protein 4 [Sesamum alatum]
MATQRKTVVQAIAISVAISLIVAGILFYFFYRFMMARRLRARLDSSFRREAETAVPRLELKQHGRAIKGVIIDEEGFDVLYVRKIEGGCFSKVWYNPMDEEVKRMDSRGEKPSMSEPIQEIPLLQEPSDEYVPVAKKPLPFTRNPSPKSIAPPVEMRGSGPPLPPPTLHQLENSMSRTSPPPPPPPPPPPRPVPQTGSVKAALPPGLPKLEPVPPPPPVKTRGLVSSHKPPIPPRGMENRRSRADEPAEESVDKYGGQMKLKPLHWDKVTTNADHSMVWNEINDGSFRFDDELMESLFGYTITSQKSTEKSKKPSYHQQRSPASVPSVQTFLLDPRKSQNVAIVLKSLAISRKEILDALLEGGGLNVDTLEKLSKICPTQEEITRILQFNGNPTKLADAESFLYHILKAFPSAFVRFNAMLFRTTYDPEILHHKQSLQTLELGCKELRSGGIFFKLLEAILKAGNRMNAGTTRGNAQGFNLTALRRLSDVKSTDGKTTLLHFVVEQVVRSEGRRRSINTNRKPGDRPVSEQDREHLMLGLPVLEALNSNFANVKKAANIDYDSLISVCPVLTTRVDEIKQLLTVESGGFLREMKGFLEDCREELNVVREEEKRVMELVRKTTDYYQAGASKGGNNPLQLFVIVKDFLNNVDQVRAEIAKKLEKRKAGTSGGSSPPTSPTPPRSPVRFQNLELYFRAHRPGTSSSDSEDDFS